jgi:hypothetical protein
MSCSLFQCAVVIKCGFCHGAQFVEFCVKDKDSDLI